ncbi:Hsp20/alpha crystallin family protein [Candidatus Dojkabacteria bacterium]|nr:Hsp20/alpha crystallin family protein [Candidatus Dojkabacteria bacterium]
MKMTVWDPFSMARRMQSWDEMFDLSEWDDTELDMFEEEDKVVIQLKAPGFDDKNVDITVEDNSVTITGNAESKEEEEDKKKKYYRKEISQRSFTRTVSLPSKVLAEQAKAEFKNGILHLELPKAEESKPKKVSIKVS